MRRGVLARDRQPREDSGSQALTALPRLHPDAGFPSPEGVQPTREPSERDGTRLPAEDSTMETVPYLSG